MTARIKSKIDLRRDARGAKKEEAPMTEGEPGDECDCGWADCDWCGPGDDDVWEFDR